MTDRAKEILLLLAAFIAGFGPAYYANKDMTAWIGWVVAGFVSMGVWIQAYSTRNPRLQPKTSEELLASVKASDMSPAAKAAVAPSLAQESAKPGSMGLPLTDQQVAAKQLYQTQRADLEALEVQRVARARLEPAEPVKSPDVDVDTLLATIETARAALAAKRAQLEAQERRLNTGLAPTSTEGVVDTAMKGAPK